VKVELPNASTQRPAWRCDGRPDRRNCLSISQSYVRSDSCASNTVAYLCCLLFQVCRCAWESRETRRKQWRNQFLRSPRLRGHVTNGLVSLIFPSTDSHGRVAQASTLPVSRRRRRTTWTVNWQFSVDTTC